MAPPQPPEDELLAALDAELEVARLLELETAFDAELELAPPPALEVEVDAELELALLAADPVVELSDALVVPA